MMNVLPIANLFITLRKGHLIEVFRRFPNPNHHLMVTYTVIQVVENPSMDWFLWGKS